MLFGHACKAYCKILNWLHQTSCWADCGHSLYFPLPLSCLAGPEDVSGAGSWLWKGRDDLHLGHSACLKGCRFGVRACVSVSVRPTAARC